ncbi:MAG: serine/threonine protein kinase, partial [Coriobacteriia bacterium]|nr:serine/threonine protein kinase [Coriobacteriia bacterium]
MSSSKNLGPYELRGELGRGAMAKVWRAWDSKLHRDVAIKEPHFDERLTQDALAELGTRFVREGVAAARLNHPGIVTIYAADIYDGRPVIVMELVEGMTLGEMLQAGALAPQVALDVLDQLLDAVAYAHSQGVVHRDIKPDNIFVSKDGRVKLSDFGIARLEDAAHTKATQIGTVLGTPGYMAPEQATGSDVDSRTDLFAIGTIAYEMLTGNNPFGAGESTNAASLLYKIVHEPEAELPIDVSAGLLSDIRPAIHTALNKSPDERPQNAAGFKAMLRGAPLETRHSTASPPDASKTQQASVKPAPSSSKRALPVLVASAGVALLVWLVITASPGQSGGSVPRSQESSSAPSVSLLQHNDTINKPELIPANVSVGNTLNLGEVSFAAYHGGNFLHAIEWQVLAVEDNRVLMISKDIIDLRP